MNAKAAKLLRRYVTLYPVTMRGSVRKAIKRRWKATSRDGRAEIASDMRKALENPEVSQRNILERIEMLAAVQRRRTEGS